MKHLAQINIGRLLHPRGDPRVAEFFNNLERINAAAERMPGFVWRLKDESGDATSISAYEDPTMLLNMSVWESPDTVEKFVWQTVHANFYRRRTGWFEPLPGPHFVMWWIEPAHVPTPAEGRARLEHFAEHGPTDHAFAWEGVAGARLWRESRCA